MSHVAVGHRCDQVAMDLLDMSVTQIAPLRRADVGYEWQVAGGIPLWGHRRPAGGNASIVTPPREWKGPEVTLTDFTCLAGTLFSDISAIVMIV